MLLCSYDPDRDFAIHGIPSLSRPFSGEGTEIPLMSLNYINSDETYSFDPLDQILKKDF